MEAPQTGWLFTFYMLHVQTGLFRVWANGKQNSRLANSILELCLPFAQIRPVYCKLAVEARDRSRKTGTPFQTYYCSQ